MKTRKVTLNFLLAPTNLAGYLTYKENSKDEDPIEILLFNMINAIITTSFIYLLFHVFHDKYFGFALAGAYLLLTVMIGVVVGTVDQAFYLN